MPILETVTSGPYAGYRRIAPGAYIDPRDALHIDVSELLAAAGIANTEPNRLLVIEQAVGVFTHRFPGTDIAVVE